MSKARSIERAAARAAKADEAARLKAANAKTSRTADASTLDSIQNFAAALGLGMTNLASQAQYGYNPVTRNRQQMEWIHRGSWLGGTIVDLIADDMTRMGVDIEGEIDPEDLEAIEDDITALNVWGVLNDGIKWSRLYGGSAVVLLIEGQKMDTPLRLETVTKGQFKGVLAFDRWNLEPSVEDLITEFGPNMGMPKFYKVIAPGFPRINAHYSRVIRMEGIRLPYQQRLTENLWGGSVLERIYDRMVAFDSTTQGASQLAYKAHLRTLSIDGLRQIIAAGGPGYQGLLSQIAMMQSTQTNEGMSIIDTKDKFEVDAQSAFSGLKDLLGALAEQVAGSSQIPLVRLLGQSPGGLSSDGDSALKTYYDNIRQRQQVYKPGITLIYRCSAASQGVDWEDSYGIKFRSLWQLTEVEKSEIAQKDGDTIGNAYNNNLITQSTAAKELRQSGRLTNRFTNISGEDIDAADEEYAVAPDPMDDGMGGDGGDPEAEGGGGGDESEFPVFDAAYVADAPFEEHKHKRKMKGKGGGQFTSGSQGGGGSQQGPKGRPTAKRTASQGHGAERKKEGAKETEASKTVNIPKVEATAEQSAHERESSGGEFFVPGSGLKFALSAEPEIRHAQLFKIRADAAEALEPGIRAALEAGGDTKTFYTKDGVYTPERKAIHKKIIKHYFEGKKPSENPRFVFLAGGSGSGKSTAAAEALTELGEDALEVNVDHIRPLLPEYGSVVGSYNVGQVNEEAGDIRDRIVAEAIAGGYSVALDGTGGASALDALREADKYGQSTEMVYVHMPVEIAIQNATSRPDRTKNIADLRRLKPEWIEAIHDKARGNFNRMSEGREVKVIDKSDRSFGKNGKVVFWRSSSGEIKVRDEEGVERVENGGRVKFKIQ